MISISVNYILHNQSIFISLALLIPNILVSLFISKLVTTPFAMVYTKMAKNSEDNFEYQGKICTLLMSASNQRIGQAEINDNGSTFRVNVKTKEGTTIEKGDTGLIINYIPQQKCYLVEPYKL
jgi:archaellum component FlaF (FlaF/FlaG flagellin family)